MKLLYCLVFLTGICFAQSTWTIQTYAPDVTGIEKNPMKGLIPGYTPVASNFPYSVDHFYVALKSTYTGWNTYDWTPFENQLNTVASKGCHAIARFYIDYPNREYALPVFLQNIVPAYTYTHHGNTKSKAPYWNDSTLIKALESFIAAFGARYDGDPRLLFIEAGLYGFWGEWHTYPENSWEMNQANKDRLLVAYTNAFKKTHVGLRQANHAGTTELAGKVGYYDDSFCYQTICTGGNWCFMYSILQRGLTSFYKYHPIGGEIYPGIQSTIFNTWPNTVGENITTCVTQTHMSFNKAYFIFKQQPTPTQYANAMLMHKMMGYQFYVSSVQLVADTSKKVTVNVKIQNKGVAPVYQNWPVEFSAIDSLGKVASIGSVNWSIDSIMPTGTDYLKTFNTVLPASGTYKILMRFKNPLEAKSPTARVLRFANSKQDADVPGWLTLGIAAIPVPVPACLPWTTTNFTVSSKTFNWTSKAIKISCVRSANISMKLAGLGPMETADYCNVFYKVNGGPQITISKNVNSFALKSIAASNIVGDSVEIIINAKTSSPDETYKISDIKVSE